MSWGTLSNCFLVPLDLGTMLPKNTSPNGSAADSRALAIPPLVTSTNDKVSPDFLSKLMIVDSIVPLSVANIELPKSCLTFSSSFSISSSASA